MPKLERMAAHIVPQVSVIPAVWSAGAVTPQVVDASGGYDRVQHVVSLGTFGTAATYDASVTESATSGGTYTLITGSAITQVTTAGADKLVLIDVPVNPDKPFQKLLSTAATESVTLGAVANCYNGTRSLGGASPDLQEEKVV